MIISNKKVLVLFRTLLIGGLETLSDEDKKIIPTTTKILYENIYPEKNYKGIYIQENFTPVTEYPSSFSTSGGSGFYRLLIWDDKNTGYTPITAADIVAEFFQEGQYCFPDEDSGFYIDYKEIGNIIADKSIDKVYVPITIYYRKF